MRWLFDQGRFFTPPSIRKLDLSSARAGAFPADLLAQGGPFIHFDAADAGETWTARHGMPLTMEAVGSPAKVDVNGVTYLNFWEGLYRAEREPWPSGSPFSIWTAASSSINLPYETLFYNGHAQNTRDASNILIELDPQARFIAGNNRSRTWNFPEQDVPLSVEWFRPVLSDQRGLRAYANGQEMTVNSTATSGLGIDASGPIFCIGGEPLRDAEEGDTSHTYYPGAYISDVLLTVGWSMDETQRAAMERYRAAKVAA